MNGTHTPKRQDDENQPNAQDVNASEDLESAPLYESFSEEIAPSAAPASEQPAQDDGRLAALAAENAALKDQLMRAMAEAENTRKRSIREREDASRFAVSGFAKDIINVADNLRRALEALPAEIAAQNPQVKNLADGIAATERELLRSFEKNGIARVEPLDQPFDPNFHEVMFEVPMADKPNATVIQVIETGYTLNGRILRPARVGVSKNDSAASAPQAGSSGHTLDTQA